MDSASSGSVTWAPTGWGFLSANSHSTRRAREFHPGTASVLIDVGTNNQTLLDDVHYIGYPKRRVSDPP